MANENNLPAIRGGAISKTLRQSLAIGSLDDLVRVKRDSNAGLLLDCSGSMAARMKNGRTRMQGLRESVEGIQSERRMPMIGFGLSNFGQREVAVIEFIPEASGGTPLAAAINLAREEKWSRAIVVSDGEPNDFYNGGNESMEAARRFGGRIDVVFVGDSPSAGEDFLRRLAESTGGTAFTGDLTDPKKITGGIMGLLAAGSSASVVDDEDDD